MSNVSLTFHRKYNKKMAPDSRNSFLRIIINSVSAKTAVQAVYSV
jgi:hypothetical protein